MGLFTTLPDASGARFRDDYGATCNVHMSEPSFRTLRNSLATQSAQIVTEGGINNAN